MYFMGFACSLLPFPTLKEFWKLSMRLEMVIAQKLAIVGTWGVIFLGESDVVTIGSVDQYLAITAESR